MNWQKTSWLIFWLLLPALGAQAQEKKKISDPPPPVDVPVLDEPAYETTPAGELVPATDPQKNKTGIERARDFLREGERRRTWWQDRAQQACARLQQLRKEREAAAQAQGIAYQHQNAFQRPMDREAYQQLTSKLAQLDQELARQEKYVKEGLADEARKARAEIGWVRTNCR